MPTHSHRYISAIRLAVGCGAFCQILLVSQSSSLALPLRNVAFAVKSAPASGADIASIQQADLDSTVDVQATVKSITRPREGSKAPFRVNLTDATGSINLIIWPDTYDVIDNQYHLAEGDVVHVNARVTEYRGERQMTLKSAGDLQVTSKAAPASPSETTSSANTNQPPAISEIKATPLAQINTSMMGQEVVVQGKISEVREPQTERAPFIVTLAEGDAQLPLVYWKDLQEQVGTKMRVGNLIRVKATVGEHRGTLQIRLQNPANVEVVTSAPEESKKPEPPAAAATSKAPAVVSAPPVAAPAAPAAAPSAPSAPSSGKASASQINESWVNRTVTISGQIVKSDNIGKGQRLTVRDQSGEIVVILWDSVFKGTSSQFTVGHSVTVTGPVKLYRGRVEIVPESADAAKLN
jgi:DNA/RNA endonuclease YhcR with UshA esterase domain